MHHKTYFMSPHLGDLPDQMLAITGRDLLIAVSYLRYAADTLRALRQARTLGIRTLVITDDPISPPSKAADVVLIAPSKATKLFHSPVAPLSLVNALVAAATVAGKQRSTAHMARAYETIDAFEVLLTPGEAPEVESDTVS